MIYNGTMMGRTGEKTNSYERPIEILWLTIVLLLPLFFNPASHQAFYLNKVLLFQFIVLLMAALSIGDWIYRGHSIGQGFRGLLKSPLHLCIVIFSFIAIVTTVMSITPGISFWGSYTRKEGLLTLLCGVVFFFIISGYIRNRQQVSRVIYTLLISSAIVSIIGILQSFFPLILFGYNPGTRGVYSTMGNALALSVFLTMVMPFNLALIFQKWNGRKTNKDILLVSSLVILFVINFWCLWLAQYSITILLYIIAPVIFILLFGLIKNKKIIVIPALLVFIILFVIAAIVLVPLLSQEYNDDGAGDRGVEVVTGENGLGLRTLIIRIKNWEGAIDLITKSPEIPLSNDLFSPVRTLTGYGLETYIITNQSFNLQDVEGYRSQLFTPFDRPHNHYLYVATSMGLLGLVSYLSILVVFFYLSFRFIRKSRSDWNKVLIIALAASVAGYMADAFFNPSTISAELLFWLLPGMLFVTGKFTRFLDDEELQIPDIEANNENAGEAHLPNKGRYYISLGCAVLLVAGIFNLIARPFLADMYLQRGLNLSATNTTRSIQALEKAITLEPEQAVYRSFLGQYSYFIARQQSDLNVKQNFLRLSTFELEEANSLERYVASRYYTLADVYFYWALYDNDDKLEKALSLYQQASQLSPRNVLIVNRWAVALYMGGDIDKAVEKLDIATTIDPGWIGTSMISTIILYNEGRTDEAAEILIKPVNEEPANLLYFIDQCFYLSAYDMVYPLDDVLTEYSSSEPGDWVPHAMRGVTSYCLNLPDKSLNEFDTAMSLVPDEYAGEVFRSALNLSGYSKIYKGMLSVVASGWRDKLSKTINAERYLNQLDALSN